MLNLGSLNPQQRLAVETIAGPVLILAGAGTGKTRVITYRIAHLMEMGVAGENILAVTFTNKAAREMQERVRTLKSKVRGLKSKDAHQPTICTFHSLCVRILRQHIEKLGYKRNFIIYNESEQISVMRKILARISVKGEKTDPAKMLMLLSRFRNGGKRAVIFKEESAGAMAQHIRGKYESALRACNAVDFDDLILLTLRLFTEHPAALTACRNKYRYVLVDEYQDTNATQFQLVHALTQEHRNLCVVGDDDQSIYGWRGAEIANLLEMEKHFPDVKIIKLEQNYRSTNTILEAANAVIKHNVDRRGKRLWSQKGTGAKITLAVFENEEEEARTIAQQIGYAHVVKRAPWAEQAILFRTNLQSRPIEIALRQADVPYRVVGAQSFFDRREVRDLLAYLKMLVNPNDDISLLRIVNVPARGLSDTTMERLLGASQSGNCSVFEVMKNPAVVAGFPKQAQESIGRFVGFIERQREYLINPQSKAHSGWSAVDGPQSVGDWAKGWLNEIRYFAELRRSEKKSEVAEDRIRSVQELIGTLDNAGSPDEPPMERLQVFIEDIMLDTERETEDDIEKDAVTLITIHSCKGLEFRHVYVLGMEDGLLPHHRSKEEDPEGESTVDEERRLFYVAMTRAMETLNLSYCSGRKKYGVLTPCYPSPFLKELPAELVEDADEKAQQPVTVKSGKEMFATLRNSLR